MNKAEFMEMMDWAKEQTMSGSIKRSDAIKALDTAWINGTSLLDANEAIKQLNDLPSADTEIEIIKAEAYAKGIDSERKRISDWCRPSGEWTIEEFTSIYGKGYRLTCSECGDVFTATDEALLREHYCRYCGAKNSKRWKGADDE